LFLVVKLALRSFAEFVNNVHDNDNNDNIQIMLNVDLISIGLI